MELRVVLMLLAGAVVSCAWNLLSKRSVDKQAFLWLCLAVLSVGFFVPFVLVFTSFSRTGWMIALASGVVEAVYFLLLGSAYQYGDLSLVYPLARGSAPVFVTVIARVVLGERVSVSGLLGIVAVVAGIYALHLRSFDRQNLLAPLLSLREKSSRLALLTGVTISVYMLIDKVGVQYVPPIQYAYLIFLIPTILLAPYMLSAKRKALVREWQANKLIALLAAVMFVISYSTVLIAMTTSKVSYVSSVRETSVVFAALAGTFILREPFGEKKIMGSLLIFFGIALIGLSR